MRRPGASRRSARRSALPTTTCTTSAARRSLTRSRSAPSTHAGSGPIQATRGARVGPEESGATELLSVVAAGFTAGHLPVAVAGDERERLDAGLGLLLRLDPLDL